MEALSYCQLMERCLAAEARVVELAAERDAATLEYDYLNDQIEYWKTKAATLLSSAELESRTVKLPPRVDCSNVPFAAHTWNCCIDEVESCLTAAGIKWEVK